MTKLLLLVGVTALGYSATLTSPVWQKTLNFGPISDVSVALYDIDNDGKDEIFVGTSKALDGSLNEVRPAGLICLEDDGTVKWTRTFPAIAGTDVQTGRTYNTTSVSTAPFFANLDDDPQMEILVGVGAGYSNVNVGNIVGQPGDKGGVYALDNDGSILWFHESMDVIGGSGNVGDNRPDGVYGSPIVYDIDNDGAREVIYNSWDQRTWILNAQTGAVKNKIFFYDTIWSTPAIADIDNNGKEEILVTADITANATVGTQTGGIFHVTTHNGVQNIAGFDAPVANPTYQELRGKYEEQALWSSPITADIDNDGYLEIVYGTGNYVAGKGEYIRVWNHDGTLKFKLPTIGKTFATPLIADIDNDGSLDIVAATLEGYIYAWDKNGNEIFYSHIDNNAIFDAPIAVDVDGDGKMEIAYASGAQITIVDIHGNQVNAPLEMVEQFFKGSPAIKDIDNDGKLDLISGGTTPSKDQAVVYRWNFNTTSSNPRVGRYQYIGDKTNVRNFVSRFYQVVLGRNADPSGLNDWTEKLVTAAYGGADIARGFINSAEFNKDSKDDTTYVTVLYNAFFNRPPDTPGMNDWLNKLASGTSKETVLDGFLKSNEFANLARAYNIKPIKQVSTNGDVEAFVQRFYQEILGRSADASGLADWTNQLVSGTRTGADIAKGFIYSAEYDIDSKDNISYVQTLYRAFFNREADTDGLNGWVNALNQGASKSTVLDGFLRSQEFANLTQAYGIIAIR